MEEVTAFLKDVSFSYGNTPVLKGASVEIRKGEFSLLSGENGSGKSTLIKILLGILKPSKGSVLLKSRRTYYIPQITGRGNISFPVTCLELAQMGLIREMGFIKIPGRKITEKAVKALEKMGMEDFKKRSFSSLSGGQKQRVMLSSALASDPEFLVLDEPTAGMDERSRKNFAVLLKDLAKNDGISILMITHEVDEMAPYAERIYKMEGGRIKCLNSPS